MPNRETRRAGKLGDVPRLRITVDAVPYLFDMRELSSEHELDLFNASGLTIARIGPSLEAGAVAPFMVAALVYLARRQAGEKVPYAAVSEAIGYGSEIEVEVLDEDAEDAAPEAPAAD